MQLEIWHLVAIACVWLIAQPVHRWLRLREKELDQAGSIRQRIAESPDPVQAATALAQLEAFEQTMKQSQENQEKALEQSASQGPESIEIEGKTFHPILSFSDFQG